MTENKYISHELGLCGNECGYWSCVIWATWIKNEKDPAHLQKGKNGPSRTKGQCNPLEVVITNPLDPRWKKRGTCDIRNQWGQTGSSSKYLGSRRSLQTLSWASVSNFLWWTKCASTRNSRKNKKFVFAISRACSPVSRCHFMLCMWRNCNGKSMAMGSLRISTCYRPSFWWIPCSKESPW